MAHIADEHGAEGTRAAPDRRYRAGAYRSLGQSGRQSPTHPRAGKQLSQNIASLIPKAWLDEARPTVRMQLGWTELELERGG